jgi:glycosyltransferase involved in cell wall biosynthesis
VDIVLALHQFPPFGGGGTERLVAWTADGLRARGHRVRIVSAIPRHARVTGIALPRQETVRFLAADAARSGDEASRIRREYDDPVAGQAFGAMLDEQRPDLVHFFHLAGLTGAAVREATGRGLPVVFTATDFWLECPTVQLLLCDHSRCAGPQPGRLNCARHLMEIRHPGLHGLSKLRAFDRPAAGVLHAMAGWGLASSAVAPFDALAARSPALLSALADVSAVIAPTRNLEERLQRFGIPRAKLRFMPYGVPASSPNAHAAHVPGTPLRVAFIGTLAAHKGAHLLVEALERLPSVELHANLFGELADNAYCRRLQTAAGRDARVRLCGRFEADAMADVLAETDVLVVPSLWDENAPLVLLQALAHRCPVIAADVPGLVEPMRLGIDGWTFQRNDAADLAATLARIAADPAMLRSVRAASSSVRTVDDVCDDLLALYERCGTMAVST